MPDEGPSLAPRACLTCRKQKRKCTKEIPECSLCRKNGRLCDYSISDHSVPYPDRPDASQSPSDASPVAIDLDRPSYSSQSAATEPTDKRHDFPAVFFLDFESFQHMRHPPWKATANLPQEMFGSFRSQSPIYHADAYFNSVHTFFPMVSKLRLYRELSKANSSPNADTCLLIMAMQLHTRQADHGDLSCRDIYRLAKESCSYVETCNVFSIRLLQANLLIALYEISNAIYPAAYLTVGHCARLGYAMGVHDRNKAPQMLSPPMTSSELEERRRIWWAVILLDRYVNIGGSYRPFACGDTRPDELLPLDDKCWDKGELNHAQPLAVSTSTAIQVCPFARTCQASHLLFRVLRNISDGDTDPEFRYQEAIQLHHTLKALQVAVSNKSDELLEKSDDPTAHLPLFTARALCYSALLSLYDKYSCSEKNDVNQLGCPTLLEMQKIAIAELKEASSAVFLFANDIWAIIELGGLLRASPLICDCLYQAASNYLWVVHEAGDQECLSRAARIKDVLRSLGTRWKSANEYIKALQG